MNLPSIKRAGSPAPSADPAKSLNVKGALLRGQNRWEDAVPEYETALALNHNFVGALTGLAWCKLAAGSIEEVIPLVEQAIRLSPSDPGIGFRYYQIGNVHLLRSRTDDAIVWLEKARTALPSVPNVRGRLASAYALRGEDERAAAELAEARRLNGGDLYSAIRDHNLGVFTVTDIASRDRCSFIYDATATSGG